MSVGKSSIKRVQSGKKEAVAPLAEEKKTEKAAPAPEAPVKPAGKKKNATLKKGSARQTHKTEIAAEATKNNKEKETAGTFVQVTDEMPYYLL